MHTFVGWINRPSSLTCKHIGDNRGGVGDGRDGLKNALEGKGCVGYHSLILLHRAIIRTKFAPQRASLYSANDRDYENYSQEE